MNSTYNKIAEIDISEYPIIRVNAKLDSPTIKEAEYFINDLLKTIKQSSGNFVIIVDATDTKWANKEIRTMVGVGFQYLEKEYIDRYKKIFFCFPSLKLRFLHSLMVNFIKAEIPEERYNSIEETNKKAKEFIQSDEFK